MIGAGAITLLVPDTQAPVDLDSIPVMPVRVRLRALSTNATLIQRNLAIKAHRTMGLAPGGIR